MHLKIQKACAIGTAAVSIWALALPAGAATSTSSFGPQSWSNGTQSGRYRALQGAHKIVLTCSGSAKPVDLRVDVIGDPDVSEGLYSYTCGVAGYTGGHIDSYGGDYRGHYLETKNSWTGTMKDTHNVT